jgi:hypothetical protein
MSNVPITIQGLSASNSATSGATILTQAQANQLLQRLRTMQNQSGSNVPQTIKIQAIQTNPVTGVKQIVAIPIQTSGASSNTLQIGSPMASTQTITVGGPSTNRVNYSSPMKIIKMPASTAATLQQGQYSGASNMDGIKVVKLSTATSVTNSRTIYSPQVFRICHSLSVNTKNTHNHTCMGEEGGIQEDFGGN